MKKLSYLLIVLLFFTSCSSTSKLSKTGKTEISMVEEFLQDMIDDTDDFDAKYRKLIAPSYVKDNQIDVDEYQINGSGLN